MIDLDAIRANATDSKRRIGEMCANLRPPKMSIPVSPNDDDEFICRTMDDLLAYVDELLAERALIVQRAENAEAALAQWEYSAKYDDVHYDALRARLAEAEHLILRMAGEDYQRARFYVEKYDLTGERAAVSATAVQPSAATENPEAMYNPVARGGHAGASARQIDVAAGDQLAAGQPERCCLDYPRCDCNSPPEPDSISDSAEVKP